MIISDFLSMLNLHNWIKGLNISSSIKFDKKSSYFGSDNISKYTNLDCLVNINKITYYNYLHNYLYFVQEYIRRYDPIFSFSDFTNVYEIKDHYEDIDSVEAQVFLETVMEEGIEKISLFLDNLNVYDYDEDIFHMFKYYNFLIEDSVEHDHVSQDVFLIEGMIEPFKKANDFLISNEYTSRNQCNENISIDFDYSIEWVVPLEEDSNFIIENNSEKSACKQTLLI